MPTPPLTAPLTGLQRLELVRKHLLPHVSLLVLLANGDVDTVYFQAVTGIDWSDAAGNAFNHGAIVLAPIGVLSLYAGQLVIKVGRLEMHEWSDALQFAYSHAGGPNDPYAGRYDGYEWQEIATDWIVRINTGSSVQPYGSTFVVRP